MSSKAVHQGKLQFYDVSVNVNQEIEAENEKEAVEFFLEWLDNFQLWNGDLIEDDLKVEKIRD